MMANGWQTVQLGEVLKQDTNYVTELEPKIYPKLSVKLYGKGVVLDAPADGANVKMQRHQFAKPGQIILSEIWAKKGAIGIVPTEGKGALVTSHFFLFDVDETKVMRDWVGLLLKRNYFADTLDAQARGTTGYAAVRPKQFLALEIPLPPLTEQRRIVAHIESLAARVNEAQRLREEASDEANSLERSLIDKVYKSCVEQYGTIELANVCDSITDGDHITPKFEEKGVKFIFVGNVSSGFLHFRNCKYVLPEYFAKVRPQRKAQLGDILYSAVGATLGVPAIVDQQEDFCFQRHIAIIKPNRIKLDSRFLWYVLRSATIFDFSWANTTGSAQPTVPLNAIRKFPVVAPPLDEQRRIVTYLDGLQAKVNALRELQSTGGEELSALMASVLDRAFKGEL
jgi:type I restriction enzyme S subunit